MKLIVSTILIYLSFSSCEKLEKSDHKTKKSVLIIGSSVPALISALVLTDLNNSVTIIYSTNDVDNTISPVSTVVKGVTYRFPKHHPAIYENSEYVRSLSNFLRNSFSTKDEIYLYNQNRKGFSISSDESVFHLIFSAIIHECMYFKDIVKSNKIIKAIKNYDYLKYRTLYSNISLAQFAKLMDAPNSFVSCFLNSSLINWGSTIDEINAADALTRMQYYFFKGKNPLRNYHMNNNYTSPTESKLLVDQIIHQLKIKNTRFISNYSMEALWVDPDLGMVLGDINDQSVKYDYIIICDTLSRSKKLLDATKSYNSGAPKIFNPLVKALESLNQYSNSPNIRSLKIWFSENIKNDRNSIIEVNNSPFPNSIQSVRQLDKLCGDGNPGNILEVIIADKTVKEGIKFDKIFKELSTIFPELEENKVETVRADFVDIGTLMDVNYGMNRLSPSSFINFGIKNLILGADWLDAEKGVLSYDIEKSVIIGIQAGALVPEK